MTSKEKKENTLINALEKYTNSTEKVRDIVYDLVDGKCRKTDVSYIISMHKARLKRLEILLKNF